MGADFKAAMEEIEIDQWFILLHIQNLIFFL